MTQPFKYYLRVRYGECDAQRVVFNARYGEYVDIATVEFLRALGYGSETVNGELDYQVVKQTLEWKASAHFDQILEISVSMKHVGTTSFTISTEFRIAGDEKLIVLGETVHVLIDGQTMAKIPLPAKLRTNLERGAVDAVTDHAGYLRHDGAFLHGSVPVRRPVSHSTE